MKKKFLNILPFLLTSLIVIGFWKLWTWTDNYAWNPKGKELLMLDIALTSIFFYKTFFWLIMTNLTVLTVIQLKRKNYKTVGTVFSLIVAFYFIAGQYIDKKCASHYYTVFHNQSVAEGYINRPIIEAGYHIGHILTEKIADKEMKYRVYAIGGLEELNYKPATPTLKHILLDKTENEIFRANSYQALNTFDTEETRKILNDFRNQTTDTLDKRVIELGDYFIQNK